jgi:hypothetical protein
LAKCLPIAPTVAPQTAPSKGMKKRNPNSMPQHAPYHATAHDSFGLSQVKALGGHGFAPGMVLSLRMAVGHEFPARFSCRVRLPTGRRFGPTRAAPRAAAQLTPVPSRPPRGRDPRILSTAQPPSQGSRSRRGARLAPPGAGGELRLWRRKPLPDMSVAPPQASSSPETQMCDASLARPHPWSPSPFPADLPPRTTDRA